MIFVTHVSTNSLLSTDSRGPLVVIPWTPFTEAAAPPLGFSSQRNTGGVVFLLASTARLKELALAGVAVQYSVGYFAALHTLVQHLAVEPCGVLGTLVAFPVFPVVELTEQKRGEEKKKKRKKKKKIERGSQRQL